MRKSKTLSLFEEFEELLNDVRDESDRKKEEHSLSPDIVIAEHIQYGMRNYASMRPYLGHLKACYPGFTEYDHLKALARTIHMSESHLAPLFLLRDDLKFSAKRFRTLLNLLLDLYADPMRSNLEEQEYWLLDHCKIPLLYNLCKYLFLRHKRAEDLSRLNLRDDDRLLLATVKVIAHDYRSHHHSPCGNWFDRSCNLMLWFVGEWPYIFKAIAKIEHFAKQGRLADYDHKELESALADIYLKRSGGDFVSPKNVHEYEYSLNGTWLLPYLTRSGI